MKSLLYLLLFVICFITEAFSQGARLNLENSFVNTSLVENETSTISYFILQDTLKIELGKLHTKIKKKEDKLYVITHVKTKQSLTQWNDSSIVAIKNFKPIYHSASTQQREMVLNLGA